VRVQPKTVQIRSIDPWGDDPMAKFDQETLRKLHDCKEVAIRTTKHPGSAVTIWAVVSSTDVSYVLCVGPKDAGIGTWPTAGLPRWSSTVSS
jgi:hypothetical protein